MRSKYAQIRNFRYKKQSDSGIWGLILSLVCRMPNRHDTEKCCALTQGMMREVMGFLEGSPRATSSEPCCEGSSPSVRAESYAPW